MLEFGGIAETLLLFGFAPHRRLFGHACPSPWGGFFTMRATHAAVFVRGAAALAGAQVADPGPSDSSSGAEDSLGGLRVAELLHTVADKAVLQVSQEPPVVLNMARMMAYSYAVNADSFLSGLDTLTLDVHTAPQLLSLREPQLTRPLYAYEPPAQSSSEVFAEEANAKVADTNQASGL